MHCPRVLTVDGTWRLPRHWLWIATDWQCVYAAPLRPGCGGLLDQRLAGQLGQAMQGLSSAALGAPVETHAASDAVERQDTDFDELRRAAVDRLSASQRHRMGVLPGLINIRLRNSAYTLRPLCFITKTRLHDLL